MYQVRHYTVILDKENSVFLKITEKRFLGILFCKETRKIAYSVDF